MAPDLGGPMGEANYGLALQEGGRLSTSLGGPAKPGIKARPRWYAYNDPLPSCFGAARLL
jgi:hypothetical protein